MSLAYHLGYNPHETVVHMTRADMLVVINMLQKFSKCKAVESGSRFSRGITFTCPGPERGSYCELRYLKLTNSKDYKVNDVIKVLELLTIMKFPFSGGIQCTTFPIPALHFYSCFLLSSKLYKETIDAFVTHGGDRIREWLNVEVTLHLTDGGSYAWHKSMWNEYLRLVISRREWAWARRELWPRVMLMMHVLQAAGMDRNASSICVKRALTDPLVCCFRSKDHTVEKGGFRHIYVQTS